MQNIDTTKDYLLSDFIKDGKDNSYMIENVSLYTQVDDIQIPTSNFFYEKYRGLILNNCIKVKIPEKSIALYRYKPKKLSYDLYGTVDLWHILLWINNMYSVTQFNERSIYIFNPNSLSVLIRIINYENDNILTNRNNIPIIDTTAETHTRR